MHAVRHLYLNYLDDQNDMKPTTTCRSGMVWYDFSYFAQSIPNNGLAVHSGSGVGSYQYELGRTTCCPKRAILGQRCRCNVHITGFNVCGNRRFPPNGGWANTRVETR